MRIGRWTFETAKSYVFRRPMDVGYEFRDGFVFSYRLDSDRYIKSFPRIEKWYFKPLWPYVWYKAIQAILQIKRAHDA